MSKMNRDQIITQEAADAMIADGDLIIVYQDFVLRLNSWLPNHPGGRLAILHMVGRDATSEITSYHSAATLKTMKAFRIGRKPMGPWISRTPPIRATAAQKHLDASPIDASPRPDAGTEKTLIGHSDLPVVDAAIEQRPPTHPSPAVPGAPTVDYNLNPQATCQLQLGSCTRRASPLGSPNRHDVEKGARRECLQGAGKLQPETRGRVALSKEEYTNWAIQQGKSLDLSEYPSLDQDVQDAITEKYMRLHERIVEEGLYECRYIEYAKEASRYLSLFALFLFTLHHGWYITSACALGLFWHQLMFTAHDAGHRAITQIFVVDTLIGMFIADFCCGLSIGWWKSSHNIHHLITNQPEHDPDIQNVPLFATCPSFFKSISSTYYEGFVFAWDAVADFMIPYQQYTYYPIMGIARFNLYLLSWLHVLSSKSSSLGSSKAWWIRPTEITFMACYWFLFGYLLLWRSLPDWTTRVIFVLVSHIITMPLHVQITLSHWGMSTSDLGESESFPQRQLRTTMDVECPAWLDFIHGGLQFQAVHHLFPRVPRHNLRRVQTMVRQFCQETEIPYSILSFLDGNRKVLNRLEEVGEQVKIMVKCQKYMAKTGESGLH